MTMHGAPPDTPSEPPADPARRDRRVLIGGVSALALLVTGGILWASGLAGGNGPGVAIWRPGRTVPASTSQTPQHAVLVSGTGDIIMGAGPGALPPDGGRGFFAGVQDSLRSDLQMGNLEQPLTEDTGFTKCPKPSPEPSPASSAGAPASPTPSASTSPAPQSCFAFRVPPSYATVLRDGGFKVLNLANNHTFDFGAEGYRHTTAALEAAGLRHTGAPGQITVLEAKGVRVAVLGFSPFGSTQSVLDVDGAVSLVKRAHAQADVVIVQMQHGAEGADQTHTRPGPETYLGENRGDSMRFAHAVVDAGADLVIGHGPHVMRGMEFYQGRLIAYSMGNFAGYRSLAYNGLVGVGGIVKVGLRRDGSFVSATLVATRMVAPGLPALDPQRQALSLIRSLSDADFPATGVRVGEDGTITAR